MPAQPVPGPTGTVPGSCRGVGSEGKRDRDSDREEWGWLYLSSLSGLARIPGLAVFARNDRRSRLRHSGASWNPVGVARRFVSE